MLKGIRLRLLAETEEEDLHLLLGELLVVVLNDQVDECVRHEHVVEVLEVTLQFVVEGTISETVEDLLSFFDWLIVQNDLLDLIVSLDQDVNIQWIKGLVIGEQALQLEKTYLLDRFGCIKIEAIVDDFNGHVEVAFNSVTFSRASSGSLSLHTCRFYHLLGCLDLIALLRE